MTITISVPDRYAYVLLAAVGAGWLTMWQAILVGKHRKRAQVPYPQGNKCTTVWAGLTLFCP